MYGLTGCIGNHGMLAEDFEYIGPIFTCLQKSLNI